MASNGIINPNQIHHEIETLKSQKQEIEARISLLQSQLHQQDSSSSNESCSPTSSVQSNLTDHSFGVQVSKTSKHKKSQRRLCEQPLSEIGEKRRRTIEMEMSERQEEDKKPGDQAAHINLKVLGQGGNDAVFRMKRSSQLKKLMNAYCAFQSVDFWSIAFIFVGLRILEDWTPDKLEMEDGDVIHAIKVPQFP